MQLSEFIHLRVHSAYSLSEGAIRIKDLAALCAEHAMPAVAIADTNNLFGALEFSNAMAGAGIQPIIGCALAVSRTEQEMRKGRPPEPEPLVLLVQNETGYENLLHLVSKAHLEVDPGLTPQVSLQDVLDYNGGLICLTGGSEGPLAQRLAEEQTAEAEKLLDLLSQAFGDRLYIELQRHNLEQEDRVEPALIDMAFAHDIPLVATNQCFFPSEEMYEAHDALLCIAGSAYVSQTDRRRVTREHRFKSAADMKAMFADLPEAIANTRVIAQRCAFKVPERPPILPKFDEKADESAALRETARTGLEERLNKFVFAAEMDEAARNETAKPYWDRLDYELDIIEQMGFPGYFMIVADFIQWAKDHNVPVGPGRGSGAGSVAAWALTITDLDPLRFGLLFERFLNPERVSMPDFDVDFCQEKRDQVIRYVQEKYGHDQVAQIITFGKLQARAALRDVGRVLELPYGQVDRICKMVPNNPANPVTLAQAIEDEPRLREERDKSEDVAHMLDIALKLEGLYRHASTHAAGVVIGDRPLDQLIPLYRDPRSEMPVTQFNMNNVEPAGLVKFDFLGLKTLSVIQRAVELVAQRTGETIDPIALPLDDEGTFALMGRGETVGVFQLESSGMRDNLKKLHPDKFEDIIAMVSLYRPGPMDNIPTYIKRKLGEEKPDYIHETLHDVLEETYGVIIYQEQVMQIAQILAGYSLGDADLLRRAMGKKKQAEMDKQRARFVEGATERGLDANRANTIFDLLAKFAGYGFNKSHAAAYALVAYQTGWFKANYPVEFMAASMTFDMNNTDKLAVFKRELGRMNVALLPPCINSSEVDFSVEQADEGLAVRYALAAIKNVGAQAMRSIIEEREANGPFKDLFDFAERIDPHVINKRQMENLIRAGAFDGLSENRKQLFESVDLLLRHASAAASDRGSNQESLFGDGGAEIERPKFTDTRDWNALDRLSEERDAIGFFLTAHPLDSYQKALKQQRVVSANDLMERVASGASAVRLAGIVSKVMERKSQRGNRYAFVELSDPTGSFEVTVFSEILATNRERLVENTALVVSAEARLEDDIIRLTANRFEPLDKVVAEAGTGLRIVMGENTAISDVQDILGQAEAGRGLVNIVISLDQPARRVEIELPTRYAISPNVMDDMGQLEGVLEIQEI